MNVGSLIVVPSISASHFAATIAQDAGANADIPILDQGLSAGRRCRAILRGISILSQQNLAWELWLFSKATYQTGVIDTDSFRGFWSFAAGDAKRIAGAGFYYYYVDGLYVPYEDDSALGQLHATLVNRSVTGKLAQGAGGDIVVKFLLENAYGR